VGLGKSDVVDAAVEIADQQGFEAVTISNVAKKLGVRSQSIYAHVDALAGLRRQVKIRAYQLLSIRIRESVLGLSPREAMVAWPMAVSQFDREHPGLFAARLAASGDDHDPELVAALDDAESVPKALVRSFGLDERESLHRDRMTWAALYGYEALRQANRFRSAVDPEETLRKLVQALADDLAGGGPRSRPAPARRRPARAQAASRRS
jgi:AcrR family transcriptional regulator